MSCPEGCGCGPCSTLVMGPDPDYRPKPAPEGKTAHCVFCRNVRQVHHRSRLGFDICVECAKTL